MKPLNYSLKRSNPHYFLYPSHGKPVQKHILSTSTYSRHRDENLHLHQTRTRSPLRLDRRQTTQRPGHMPPHPPQQTNQKQATPHLRHKTLHTGTAKTRQTTPQRPTNPDNPHHSAHTYTHKDRPDPLPRTAPQTRPRPSQRPRQATGAEAEGSRPSHTDSTSHPKPQLEKETGLQPVDIKQIAKITSGPPHTP